MTLPRNQKRSPGHAGPARSIVKHKLLLGLGATALIAGFAFPHFSNAAPIEQAAPSQAARPMLPDFTSLVERVKPAVISVQVKINRNLHMSRNENGGPGPNPFNGENPFKGTPFEHFFDQFPKNFSYKNAPPSIVQAQGSGFFISADGYAVTNNHVVDGATNVRVVTDDGKTHDAKVIGTDPKTDLALIKVKGNKDFPFVKMATAKPKIGEWVIAVGNPFGLGGTVTAGIVSAENRDIGSGPYDDFIQIDAAVNKGNSGGPTFNLAGEVIGVNTAIFSPSGGSVGIAFDIPTSTVNAVIPVLKEKGHVERAWLGVRIQDVTDDIAQSLGLSETNGTLISEPEPDGPAQKAGLKSGDLITSLNGKKVEDSRDLARKIGSMSPNSKATLSVIRGGSERTINLTLGRMKDDGKQTLAQNEGNGEELGKLGLSVEPASAVAGAGEKGVVAINVDPDGEAASAGIRTGDVILKVGRDDVSSASDMRKALSDIAAHGKKKALALVKRGDNQMFVALSATS